MEKIQVVRVRNERGQTEDNDFISYQLCDLFRDGDEASHNDYVLSEGERLLSHSFIMDTMRKLMGRTLTIIDASIVDREQKKAIKDLIRQTYSDEMGFATEWAFDQKVMDNMIPEDIDPTELGTVTVEQALGVEK